METKTSWQGVVMSLTAGPLLGGNKVHCSLRFAHKGDAEKWVSTVIEGNELVFRPCTGQVFEIEAEPELRHCSRCDEPWYGIHKCRKEAE